MTFASMFLLPPQVNLLLPFRNMFELYLGCMRRIGGSPAGFHLSKHTQQCVFNTQPSVGDLIFSTPDISFHWKSKRKVIVIICNHLLSVISLWVFNKLWQKISANWNRYSPRKSKDMSCDQNNPVLLLLSWSGCCGQFALYWSTHLVALRAVPLKK